MSTPAVLTLGAVRVDLDTGEVTGGARLTALECRLLAHLAERPGETVGRAALLTEVWGYAPDVVTRAVDATVNRLRAKIEADPGEPAFLETVRGQGYRLVLPRAVRRLARPLDRTFGRTAECARLGSWITHERLVTVTGPAGIGKTRLATLVAAHRDAVLVELADVPEGRAAARVATALDAAADGPLLLLLDNLEPLIATARTIVRTWLHRRPDLTVLCTSRERLGVAGERVLELGPLATVDAAALLRDRVASTAPGVDLDDATARSLVLPLHGRPLAIELAAALLDVLSPSVLLGRLDDPLTALVAPSPDRPARHASLRRAVRSSWDRLSERERTVLDACTALGDGFTAAAVEARLGPSLPVLRTLRAKSVLRRAPDGVLTVDPWVPGLGG